MPRELHRRAPRGPELPLGGASGGGRSWTGPTATGSVACGAGGWTNRFEADFYPSPPPDNECLRLSQLWSPKGQGPRARAPVGFQKEARIPGGGPCAHLPCGAEKPRDPGQPLEARLRLLSPAEQEGPRVGPAWHWGDTDPIQPVSGPTLPRSPAPSPTPRAALGPSGVDGSLRPACLRPGRTRCQAPAPRPPGPRCLARIPAREAEATGSRSPPAGPRPPPSAPGPRAPGLRGRASGEGRARGPESARARERGGGRAAGRMLTRARDVRAGTGAGGRAERGGGRRPGGEQSGERSAGEQRSRSAEPSSGGIGRPPRAQPQPHRPSRGARAPATERPPAERPPPRRPPRAGPGMSAEGPRPPPAPPGAPRP